jgi:hypothetical protein
VKRIITSFKNANKDLLKAISDQFPKGVDDEALINYPKAGGGSIRALELILEDCVYLIKMESEEYYLNYLAKDEDEEDNDEIDIDEIEVEEDPKEEEDKD